MSLVKQSRCKINLLLNILGKRDDGFHELETVMQPVPLHDELEFAVGGSSLGLTTNHPGLPCDGSNLIVRAADKFRLAAQITDGVHIHVEKRIPMEAGLGGGSSNAATTLLGLNELCGVPLSAEQLHQIASDLGSDVPFFLQDRPALATGRGEVIRPLVPFGALTDLSLVLVHPGFGISTAWSYKTLAEFPDALNGRKGRAQELINALSPHDGRWSDYLHNSLEFPAFRKYPVLQLYVDEFKNLGALAAMMSGSGSTVFAFFNSTSQAQSGLESFQVKFGTAGWSLIIPNQATG
jgi:4-diphosphocytidyl-2-C-methyl-D-erythritol kinase